MQDRATAGIANAFAAELHGARVAVSDIEDHFGNQTSFALIGRPAPLRSLRANATRPRWRCSCNPTKRARST